MSTYVLDVAALARKDLRLELRARDTLPAIAEAWETFVPLDGLRTAVSLHAQSLDFQASLDITPEELKRNAMQVCAVIPTILTALYRLRHGQEPIEPHESLGYAANYLYMLSGEEPRDGTTGGQA